MLIKGSADNQKMGPLLIIAKHFEKGKGERRSMKKKLLSFLLTVTFAFGSMTGTAYAATGTVKVESLSSPEALAEAINHTSSLAKSKDKKRTLKKAEANSRVIVNSKEKPENVYGAANVYYYTFGKFYVLEYANASQAKLAEKRLEKQYDADEVFQDQIVSLDDSEKAGTTTKAVKNVGAAKADENSDSSEEAFDGIHAMGLDKLKEDAANSDWNLQNTVTVAILDTGIDVDHSWFSGRIDKRSINLAVDKEASDYDDVTGHGTHVSGIITKGTTDNVKIMTIRIFDASERASVLTLRLGVDYATTHGADVMNLSLGYDTNELISNLGSEDLSFIDDSFAIAADYGITMCVASGNEYTNVSKSYPACSGWTIAVGSIERSTSNPEEYVHSGFSNSGTLLDFCAPGGDILSAWNDGKTMIESGTSMASPHLAAAAAMIKMKHPDYTQWDVYATMRDYAVDLGEKGKDDDFGYGYVNLADYANEGTDTTKKSYQAIYVDTSLRTSIASKGKTYDLEVQLTKGDGTLLYTTTNPEVATVDSKGKVTIQGGGSCEIVITASETAKYKETSKRVTVTVSRGEQTLTVPQTIYTKYEDDKGFYLQASVDKPGDGKVIFQANKNSVINLREDGYVTITGTGKVLVYPIAMETASYTRQVGDAITIEVKKASERPFVPKEPTTTKKNDTKPANNTITKNTTVKKPAVVKIRRVTPGRKMAKIYWKKQNQINGYQIRYSLKKGMKKASVKNVSPKKVSFVIKKLKAKKTYYIQIRSYKKVNKKTIYGLWSTKSKICIK